MNSAPPTPQGKPVIGHTLGYVRDPFEFVSGAIENVADIVTINLLHTDIAVFAHPDYIEQALVTNEAAFGKSESFTIAFGDGLIAVEGEQWERQREALEEFFYPGRIRSYAEEMSDLSVQHVERWEAGERLPLAEEMKAVTLENLFGTLFDRPLELDGDREIRRAAENLHKWFKPSSWVLPPWIPTPARRQFEDGMQTLQTEAERLLDERSREGARGDDLLSTLVEMREHGAAELTDSEIVDQLSGFLFAGHDTTALALTYAFYLLGKNPDVRARFHDEIDSVLDGSRPTLDDVGNLEFTEQVLTEAIRLYPPVHTIPRETTEPVEIDGYRIPADRLVHLSVYCVHRDERFYDDPLEFRPERWADETPQSKGFAYCPFGAGPRTCIGRRFALLEATMVLAAVGQRYRLEPLTDDIDLQPQITTQPAGDVPVRIHER